MLRIAFASAVTSALAKSDEGLSLLQTAAHVRMNVSRDDLPDPKKQSALDSGEYKMADIDFQCKKGKGKWAWVSETPDFRYYVDISEKTLDIQEIKHYEDARFEGGMHRASAGWPYTYTKHDPVKNEKDCFARALTEFKCVHWMEDRRYLTDRSQEKKNLMVWYKPKPDSNIAGAGNSATHPDSNNVDKPAGYVGQCLCGTFKTFERPEKISIGVFDSDDENRKYGKVWTCQLEVEDTEDVDENTTVENALGDKGEKKEKKSKEEKEACAAAKAAAKQAKADLKDLRGQLKDARKAVKDLKAAIKAAKAAWLEKKGERKGAC